MAHSIYEDAIIDVVSPESVVSEPYLLKVRLHLLPFLISMTHPSGSPSPNHYVPSTRVYNPILAHFDLTHAHQNPRSRALL